MQLSEGMIGSCTELRPEVVCRVRDEVSSFTYVLCIPVYDTGIKYLFATCVLQIGLPYPVAYVSMHNFPNDGVNAYALVNRTGWREIAQCHRARGIRVERR